MTSSSTSSAARGYGAAYRKARARLIGHPCHRCGAPATTADHVPPLAYLRAQGLPLNSGQLLPACARCNYSSGGRLGGRRNAQRRRQQRATNLGASRAW